MTNLRRFLTRRGPASRPALYLSGVLILLVGASFLLLPRLKPAPVAPAAKSAPGETAALPVEASPSAGPQAVKIYTAEEGMYSVEAAELKQAGFDIDGMDPGELVVLYQGREQPFWVEGEGRDREVRFYAQASDSIYSTENVYWLARKSAGLETPGDKLAQPEPVGMAALPATPPDAYFATARLEQNEMYNPQVEAGDHWMWLSLPAPKSQDFEAELAAPLGEDARLTLEVWASTEGAAAPDHHLVVRVNGQPAADEVWDGKGRHTITADLPASALKEGKNIVSVEAPGDTGVAADITFVDWIEIGYARRLAAEQDRLDFTSPGGTHPLEGFSGAVQVFDVTGPEAAARLDANLIQGVFDGQPGHRYLAVGPKGYRRAARIEPAALSPDLRAYAGADYIATGPPDLLAAVQPLLDWREGKGLRMMAAPLEAVYDQFGWGMPEPEAIRAFMQYAAQHWQPAPKYLLLVGDASYDPKGYHAPVEANRLPAFLTPTEFGGETASDLFFTQLDEDSLPDLAVGRLPARTAEQVRAFVAKLLAYEADSSAQDWRGRVLAVADGQEPAFRTDAQHFLDLFPEAYETELFSPEAGVSGANEQLLGRLADGDLIVGYFGHGSINMWGKDKLFTNEDVDRLDNAGRLPVVINMTCLTGLFTHPKLESLAEALVWQPEGGAVAVLAPTSLTLPTDQGFLSRALVEAMLAERDAPLGDALLAAQRQVALEAKGAGDVLETFLLFGDPAMVIPLK